MSAILNQSEMMAQTLTCIARSVGVAVAFLHGVAGRFEFFQRHGRAIREQQDVPVEITHGCVVIRVVEEIGELC